LRTRVWLAAILSVVSIFAIDVGRAAISAPRTITLSADRLTAVAVLKSYVAWKLSLPKAGFVKVTPVGVHTGSGMAMLTDDGGSAGGSSLTNGGIDGIGAHEDPHPDFGLGGTLMEAGIHRLVVIIGGGTVPAGVEVLRVTGPKGMKALNVTTGPAIDLAESNFTNDGGYALRTPVLAAASAHGSVTKRITHRLYGFFWVNPETTSGSFVDPSGAAQSVPLGGWWWHGAAPGSYTLHIDEELPPTLEPVPGMQALFADVRLP
jgi:hypothetical protein